MELFEELNYPSATKLRAGLLKKGYKARLKDVEEFVKSQTPTQLFAKAPKYRGKIIASRPNDRWVMDFIDFSAEPSGEFKYIFLAQDIFSRKLWATAFTDKSMSSVVEDLNALLSDYEKTKELKADGEFDNPTINKTSCPGKTLLRATKRADKTSQRLTPRWTTTRRCSKR